MDSKEIMVVNYQITEFEKFVERLQKYVNNKISVRDMNQSEAQLVQCSHDVDF